MNRSNLVMGILIGAACGLAVAIGMTALAGQTLFGAGGRGGGAWITPSPAGDIASPSPAVADPGSVSSAAPTGGAAAQATAKPTVKSITAKVGRPGDSGTYRATTAVASLGDYITWRMVVDRASAGRTFGVEVGVRIGGTWTSWTRLSSRVADARGTVLFSWRQKTPSWIRVRFVLPTGPSMGLQGRWR